MLLPEQEIGYETACGAAMDEQVADSAANA